MFEKIYDMLEQWRAYEIDSQLCVAHALATYNLVNRLQKLLKLRKIENTEPCDAEYIHKILQKLEMYVLNILCHNTDKVKHIARNSLNVLVVIYREYLPAEQNLHQLIKKCMNMPWEQKIKYLALLSIFKHSSNQSSACVSAATDVTDLYPDMPNILVNQLHSVHPSLESHCAELYEVLMYNDFVRKRSQSNDSIISGDDEKIWFNTWYLPLLDLKPCDISKVSVPSVEKFISTGMQLSNQLLGYLIEHYESSSGINSGNRGEKTLKLVMIALKKQKLNDNIDLFQNPESEMKQIIVNSCFHFNEEIRIKALELLVCSKSSKQAFRKDELELILSAIPTNMVPDLRSTRQDFIHIMKKMFDRMKEGLIACKRSGKPLFLTTDSTTYYEDFLSKVGKYLLSCFYEGATSNRRGIAIEIISMIINTFIVKIGSTEIDLTNVRQEFHSKTTVDVLIKCLEDPYEQNKEFALKCLNELDNSELRSQAEENIKAYVENKWNQVTLLRCSHKPPETASAVYILLYLVKNFSCSLLETLSYQNAEKDTPKLLSEMLKGDQPLIELYCTIIDHLMISLNRQFEIAQTDVIKSSEDGPMYGTLLCIRTILELLLKETLYKQQA